MRAEYDIVIIGAGPAGMAAANLSGANGASTLLLDEQYGPGGQIYRSIENQAIENKNILGPDYYKGANLTEELRTAGISYQPGAKVWQVSSESSEYKEVAFSKDSVVRVVHARQIIIATGAQERPFPILGWTLPGVMNAGAAQILLKTCAVAAGDAVFIGSGPLLYLIIRQYLLAGVPIKAVLDTTPLSNYWHAAPYLTNGLLGYKNLLKGRGWIKGIERSGVPFIKGVKGLELVGGNSVQAVKYKKSGRWHQLETENVFLHQGVVPNINLTMSLRCAHKWCSTQLCWHVVTDEWGGTDIPGISVAGDGGSIGGAIAAEHRGAIAAIGALYRTGFVDADKRRRQAAPHRKALAKEKRFRQFLDRLFTPLKQFRVPSDNATIVCRCEEITAGSLKDIVKMGCTNPNRLKTYSRCGMGPCQGRFCGLTVSEIISQESGLPVDEVGYYRIRRPVKPVSLGELAKAEIKK